MKLAFIFGLIQSIIKTGLESFRNHENNIDENRNVVTHYEQDALKSASEYRYSSLCAKTSLNKLKKEVVFPVYSTFATKNSQCLGSKKLFLIRVASKKTLK